MINEYSHSFPENNQLIQNAFINRVSSVQNAKLAPIQVAFKQLISNPLFQNTPIHANTANETNSSASWVMARAEALFNAIYSSGVTTDQDMVRIQELSGEIEKLRAKLKSSDDVSAKQRQLDQKCLNLAQQALSEISCFPEALNQFNTTKYAFNQTLDFIVDSIASPLYEGESLTSMPRIHQAVDALLTLEKQIAQLPEESSIRVYLQEHLDNYLYSLLFYIYEWEEEMLKSMETEFEELFNASAASTFETKNEIFQQLSALKTQQSLISEQLTTLLKYLKTTNSEIGASLSKQLKEVNDEIKQQDTKIEKRLKKENIDPHKSFIVFGDQKWCALSTARREKRQALEKANRPVFADLIEALDPENWSDSTKSVVYRLLTAMQLGQQILAFNDKLSQAQYLRQQAEMASKKITPQIQQKIDRDNAYLGILLSDKYQKLLDNPQLIGEFSKDNELLQQGIKEALTHFGSKSPTRAQLFDYLDAFKLQQYAKVSQSPFAHLSISEWISLFTTPEQINEDHPLEDGHQLTKAEQKIEVPRRAIGLMGRAEEVSSIITGEMKGLAQARHVLKQGIKLDKIPLKMKQEMVNLENEIDHLQNIPEEGCSLIKLAGWMQAVEDIRFEIETRVSNSINRYLYPLFFEAIENRDSKSLKTCISQNNMPPPDHGIWESCMLIAIDGNDTDLISVMPIFKLSKKCLNVKNAQGHSALDIAINEYNLSMAYQLVKAGTDSLHESTFINFNFIVNSRQIGQSKEFYETLLRITKNYNLNAQDVYGQTLLHSLTFRNYDKEIIELFVRYGARGDIVDKQGDTAAVAYAFQYDDYQNIFGYSDYVESVLTVKTAAHALELGGTVPLQGTYTELEGGNSNYFAKIFQKYIPIFAKEFPGITESEVSFLNDSLKSSAKNRIENAQTLHREFVEGKPILLHSGFQTHAISIFLYKDYLIIGNKGTLSNKPLEMYKIDKNKITIDFIWNIQQMKVGSWKLFSNWLEDLSSSTGAVSTPLTSSIEQAYPLSQKQTVGNCAWESVETNLFGILATKRLLEPGESDPNILLQTQKTFVEMTQFFQLEAFENYLKTYLCEYHQLTPKMLEDREFYLRMKQGIYSEISLLPKTFSKKIEVIESLLRQIDGKFAH